MQEKDKQLALKYLSYRLRSEFEMRKYMAQKDVPEEDIDEIIDYLYSYKYLDDHAYAKAFINDKINFHPCGRYKIIHELEVRGIEHLIIEKALEECLPYEKEENILQCEYEKYIKKGKTHEKALRYFYTKGYPSELLGHLERS